MKVIDYKEKCLLNILTRRRRYNALEKRLQRCSSLTEQKVVLQEFYKVSTFKRDDLLARQYALQNKKSVGLKEIIFSYKDFLIAFISSLLTLYLDKIITDGLEVTVVFQKLKLWTVAFLVMIVMVCLSAAWDKINYTRKDIPLQEILDYELQLIQRALALDKEKINFEELIETN